MNNVSIPRAVYLILDLQYRKSRNMLIHIDISRSIVRFTKEH